MSSKEGYDEKTMVAVPPAYAASDSNVETMGDFPVTQKLHRQLKNRHIAMIRSVPLYMRPPRNT